MDRSKNGQVFVDGTPHLAWK